MKKLSFALLSLLNFGMLSALPVANPIDASLYTYGIWWCDTVREPCDPCYSWCDAFSMRLGFWGDYVFNRHLEDNVRDGDSIERFSIYKNQGVLTFNWCNWIDVYGLVGVANFSQQTPFKTAGSEIMVDIEYEAALSYGAGARMTLWEWGCFGVGLEGQYFGSQPKLENFSLYSNGTVNYPSNVNSSTYNEWQVGLGAAYTIATGYGNAFIPYIAIKFAGADFTQNNESYSAGGLTLSQENLENERYVGYAVGMTATVCQKGGVTVEGRFADEKAVYVNGQIRF
jgi:major outer membrane protein